MVPDCVRPCCVLSASLRVSLISPHVLPPLRQVHRVRVRHLPLTPGTDSPLLTFPVHPSHVSLIAVVVIGYDSEINYMELLQASDLVTTNTPFFFFEIMVAILALQLVKFEAVASLYELLDSKKTYVRS